MMKKVYVPWKQRKVYEKKRYRITDTRPPYRKLYKCNIRQLPGVDYVYCDSDGNFWSFKKGEPSKINLDYRPEMANQALVPIRDTNGKIIWIVAGELIWNACRPDNQLKERETIENIDGDPYNCCLTNLARARKNYTHSNRRNLETPYIL